MNPPAPRPLMPMRTARPGSSVLISSRTFALAASVTVITGASFDPSRRCETSLPVSPENGATNPVCRLFPREVRVAMARPPPGHFALPTGISVTSTVLRDDSSSRGQGSLRERLDVELQAPVGLAQRRLHVLGAL